MSETITIPFWLLALVVALAAFAVVTHIVVPVLRWLFRRRVERVIQEVNARLQVELSPFSLTRRDVLVDRIVHDPEVVELIERAAAGAGAPREELELRVRKYAREIVPAFNAYFYFRLGYAVARRFVRALYRVRLGYQDEAALSRVTSDSSVIFFMNHRSNIDYLLVTYLAANNTALSYGVGEWARAWPFQQLMRTAGAYFVRRDSGDPLYRRVLERYVQMATAARVPHAIFPEGGLSRDGAMQTPKLGLLDYLTKTFDPAGAHDIVFMPIAVNYDRVPEEYNLVTGRDKVMKERGGAFVLRSSLAFLGQVLLDKLKGRRHPLGYAVANFGTPVSLRGWLAERKVDLRALPKAKRFKAVAALAGDLMARVEAVMPVLPISLIATLFVAEPDLNASEADIEARVRRLIQELRAAGAHLYIPHTGATAAIAEALAMLDRRKLVVRQKDGTYGARPDALPLLRRHALAVAHLWPGGVKTAAQ